MSGCLTPEEAIYIAGTTPEGYENVVNEFFLKNLGSREECEETWKRAKALKEKNPHYFEELD